MKIDNVLWNVAKKMKWNLCIATKTQNTLEKSKINIDLGV